MTAESLDADAAREALYAVMNRDLSFEEKAERALDVGERYLDVDNGHVTKVDKQSDYWKAIASSDDADGAFPPGLLLDLQTTYCRRTVEATDSVAIHDVDAHGWADDPAYEEHGLDCYHGTKLTLDDEVYGTVCFVATDARNEPFADEETMFAELVARMLEHELDRERTAKRVERLEAFAGVVSHDLRNPLNVASGHIDAERASRDSEHLAAAAASLERMDDLITDVLSMARQGREVEDTEALELSVVAQECWWNVETTAATVVVEEDMQFQAAGDRVRHLFENLFRNAVEHGGEDVAIRVGVLDDDDGFFVADDGAGIDAERRDDVFETGYSTGSEGIGLGLSIVQSIVTAHDWSISVVESRDGGARFEIADVLVATAD